MITSFDQIIKSIEQLPPTGWKIRALRMEKEMAQTTNANRSAKSLNWLDENREKYSGQWVALDGD